MKPVTFPEQNKVWAENQPEYLPLPSYCNPRENISKWRLTWWERIKLLFTGTLWMRQVNLRQPLQAIVPTTIFPFEKVVSPWQQADSAGAIKNTEQIVRVRKE